MPLGFRIRLFTPDGDDAGEFHTAVPNWQPGKEVLLAPGRRLRILQIVAVEEEGSPYYAFWTVEPVDE